MKVNKNHLLCSCTQCKQEITVQSLQQHVDIKHSGVVRIQDKHSKYRTLRSLDNQTIIDVFKEVGSVSGTLRHFNINGDSRCKSYVIEVLGEIRSQFQKTRHKHAPIRERLEEIRQYAKTCTSATGLLQSLGYVQMNSTIIKQINQVLEENNISLQSTVKWTDELVYKESSAFPRNGLALRVKKDNWMEYKCSECGNGGEWNGKVLKLQIDHIDGTNNDHRKENLRWLCPNCHTQTETFCRMKKF